MSKIIDGDDILKKVIAFLTFMFLLSCLVSSINAIETRLIWNLGAWEGLDVKIWAPWQAYPNDMMTIRIMVEATEDLQDVTVIFKIYGSRSEGYILWYRPLDVLENVGLSSGSVEDQYFNVSIPDDVDPGVIHAHVSCSWKVWREQTWQERSIDDPNIHRVTYLMNKPYEDLQVTYNQLLIDYNSLQLSHNDLENRYNDLQTNYSELLSNYDSLNSTYHSLLSNYSSLQASFNELKSKYEFGGETANTLNLMYVFIETTVIFIATTIYFARVRIYSALRKSKQ